MDSRVTFKEIIVMCLVITSFTVTGIMIMNENYKMALISLCITSLCVLVMFLTIVSAEDDRILDMTNPSLRNPGRAAKKNRRVISGSSVMMRIPKEKTWNELLEENDSQLEKKKESNKNTGSNKNAGSNKNVGSSKNAGSNKNTGNNKNNGNNKNAGNSKNTGNNKNTRNDRTTRAAGYMMQDMGGDFYESVGNLRVYKRGEKIELHNDEEDENLE